MQAYRLAAISRRYGRRRQGRSRGVRSRRLPCGEKPRPNSHSRSIIVDLELSQDMYIILVPTTQNTIAYQSSITEEKVLRKYSRLFTAQHGGPKIPDHGPNPAAGRTEQCASTDRSIPCSPFSPQRLILIASYPPESQRDLPRAGHLPPWKTQDLRQQENEAVHGGSAIIVVKKQSSVRHLPAPSSLCSIRGIREVSRSDE